MLLAFQALPVIYVFVYFGLACRQVRTLNAPTSPLIVKVIIRHNPMHLAPFWMPFEYLFLLESPTLFLGAPPAEILSTRTALVVVKRLMDHLGFALAAIKHPVRRAVVVTTRHRVR